MADVCPSRASEDPIGHRDTLAEAVELLVHHRWDANATCHAFQADSAAQPPLLNMADVLDEYVSSGIDGTDTATEEESTT